MVQIRERVELRELMTYAKTTTRRAAPDRRTSRSRLLGAALAVAVWPALAASPEQDYRTGFEAFNRDDLMGAMEALGRAADAGYAPAQVLLGYIMDKANEDAAAMDLYRQAAEQVQQCIDDNLLWYEITDARGNRGWVSRRFLEEW